MEGSGHSRRRRGDGCTVVECYTPGKVVGRWLSGFRSSKEKRDAWEEEEEEEDSIRYKLAPIKCCSPKRLNQTSPETNRFESPSREAPPEMGIGSFLLYLVVASKTELDKMTNLRMQMEMFLLHAKEGLHKKEMRESPLMSSNDALAHSINVPSGYQFSPQDFTNLASSIFEGSSTSVLQEENTECEVSKPDDYNGETDRNTLPLDEKAEDRNIKHQIQRQSKLKADEVTKNHIPEMVVTNERDGVCPYELEKKLHELLETRQQEELLKLETALSRVERRLQEKEIEVSWWKDAARLLAQRVPEPARPGLEWSNPESSACSQQSAPRSMKASSTHRISFSR